MTKLNDPDSLNQGTEIVFDETTSPRTIQLVETGNLSSDGVTLQCIYSFTKEEWISDASLKMIPFPFVMITAEQGEIVNDWDLKDTTTQNAIRDGGWALKDAAGVSLAEFMCMSTLGGFNDEGVDKAYYLQDPAGTPSDIVLTGPVNQAIQIYGDTNHGSIDYRTFFKIYLREEQKVYGYYDLLTAQSLSSLTYKKYALPLSNALDLKVTHSDAYISSNAPYTGMSLTWYASAQQRNIGGTNRDFHIIVDGNNGSAEEIYEFVEYQLRQASDIDDGVGTKLGNITEELLGFVGDTLKTKITSDGGVYIDNFQSTDTNRLVFVDDLGIERTYPYVAAGTLAFNENLQNDPAAIYTLYFAYTHKNTETDVSITSASGTSGILNSTNIDLSQINSGDYINVYGFAEEGNNGFLRATGAGSANSVAVETIDGEDMVNESAAPSVTIEFNPFATPSSVIVEDNSSTNIEGDVSSSASLGFDFDYDGNVQGGRSPGVDAVVKIVAIGLEKAQYVLADATLERSTTNNISLVSSLERNYSNS